MTDLPAKVEMSAALRWQIYWILIAIGVGGMLGRVFAVDSVNLQAIEAQRLKEIGPELERREAALREKGLPEDRVASELQRIEERLKKRAQVTRPFLSGNDRSRWCTVRALVEPEMRVPGAPYAIEKVIQDPDWDTIDKVKHDGHLYSSKPPLYPTLLAAQYWVVYKSTGATLGDHPYAIGRLLIALNNVLPMLIFFWVLARLADRLGRTDFARIFMLAAAIFGTLLTTFVVVINNHLPAAVCVAVAMFFAIRIWLDGSRKLGDFICCGFFAALAVSNELPSAALAGMLAAVLLWKAPRPTFVGFLPAAAVVAAAFLGTNYVAHGSVVPAYGHRSGTDNWYEFEYERDGKIVQSYWSDPQGVDLGEPSRAVYAANALVGHHGIFSLTPIWLLTVAGLGIWLAQSRERPLREIAAMIVVVSLVVIGFYLFQPQLNRNYGGVTSGLRWTFWLAPLWLTAMLPALDACSRWAAWRWTVIVLLGLSAISVTYPTWNPWSNPWLQTLFQQFGWA